jgi:hypothetical protein
LRLDARRIAVSAEQAAAFECRERAAIAVLADAIKDDVKPARQDAREVFAFVIDRRGAQLADPRRMLAARGAPKLEPSHRAERKQRLADGTDGSMHEHALTSLYPGLAVKELVCGRPAQDQRGRLRRVDARWHTGQALGQPSAGERRPPPDRRDRQSA